MATSNRIKLGTIECTQCTVLMGVFHQQKPEPILIGLDVVQDVCFLRSTQRAHRRCIAVDFNLTLSCSVSLGRIASVLARIGEVRAAQKPVEPKSIKSRRRVRFQR